MRFLAVLPFALVLSGCSPAMMMERSPEYELGYSDGCSNGLAQGQGALKDPKRNDALFAKDEGYRRGWNSGNAQCRPVRPGQF